jgi:putative aldouronate transport system substrate-binding protein
MKKWVFSKSSRSMLALLALVTAGMTVLSGCSSKQEASSSTASPAATEAAKPVKLRWVFPGAGKQKDSEEVWAEFNKRLQVVLPNTTIQFEEYPIAEFAEKWKLLAASGEAVDLAWMGYVQDVAAEVNKGSYLPLDDLLKKTPAISKELPSWLMDLAKFNGKQYGIPNFQLATDLKLGLRVPMEFVDAKYIDVKQAQDTFTKYGSNSKEAYAVIDQYLAKLKDNNQLRKGVSTFSLGWAPGDNHGPLGSPFKLDGDFKNAKSLKVVNLYDTPAMKLSYDVAADWFKKGYIRKDILSLQNPRVDEGKQDGYVTWVHNIVGDQSKAESARYGFPIEVIPMEQEYLTSRPIYATMTGISRTSKNPERAMQVLELMNTAKGKDLYNLLVWGMDGKHYKKTTDNRIETIGYSGQGTADAPYGLFKWVMGNTINSFETQADPEGYTKLWQDISSKSIISPVLGFKPNAEPVKTEIAQVQAVVKE